MSEGKDIAISKGKGIATLDNKILEPGIVEPLPIPIEPMIKQKDCRLLRECLASIHGNAPPQIKQKIVMELKRFAEAIKGYCLCTDRSYVAKEAKFACLDCGKRFWNQTGPDDVQELG